MGLSPEQGQVVFKGDRGAIGVEVVLDGRDRVPIVVLMNELPVREVEDVLDDLVDAGLHGYLIALIIRPPGLAELCELGRRPRRRRLRQVVPDQNEPGTLLRRPGIDGGTLGDPIRVRNVHAAP